MNIKFKSSDDSFYRDLKKEVRSYFQKAELSMYASYSWYIKSLILITSYLLVYLGLLTYGKSIIVLFVCYGLLGFLTIVVGINIGHDAAHGSISRYNWINKMFLMIFDLLGANSYIWKLRHVHSHHVFPNVAGKDMDIAQTKLVRIFPTDLLRSMHRYQHLYSPVLFVLVYTINWMFIRDFLDFTRNTFGEKIIKTHPTKEYIKLIFFKTYFIIAMVVLPHYILGLSLSIVLLGFMIFHLCAGITVSCALVSAHIGDTQEFPSPNDNGEMDHDWATHQTLVTADFCTSNSFITFIFGGFNHHVFHHLFPKISHIHYPNLTPLLIKVSKKHDKKYLVIQEFSMVLKSHLSMLKKQGWSYWKDQMNDVIG